MNLLAHLHLSEGRPVATAAGNVLADYLRRTGATDIDSDFTTGVRLHRAIDAYAEAHPATRKARACISPARRRLGGIIVDVAYDFFLSQAWDRYSALPLREFVASRLGAIRQYLESHPSPLRPLVDRAIEQGWLLSYGTMEGLRTTFDRVANRAPAAAPLRGAEEEVERNGDHIQRAFTEFYPQLMARCEAISAVAPARNANPAFSDTVEPNFHFPGNGFLSRRG
jgi:acyl carrier protein phosphodiesterase